MKNTESGTPLSIEAFHSKEYTLFISQIGFANPGQMKVIFDQPESLAQANPQLKATMLAGRAKIASLEGNFPIASNLFDNAFDIANKELKINDSTKSRSTLAYVHFEYGLFLKKLHSPNQALVEFKQAKQLNPAVKLKYLISYFIESLALDTGGKNDISKLIKYVDRFKFENLVVMHIIGLQRLGNLIRDRRNLGESEKHYKEALNLAEMHDLQYLVWTIKNSIGLLLHKQKKFQAAVDFYEGFIDSVESHYLKSIVMKSLALKYRLVGREDEAIQLSKEGLEYSQTHGVISTVPTFAALIGDLIIKYTDTPQEAYHYYKIGYDESLRQQEAGLPITGPRLHAVKKYTEYLASYLPDDFNKSSVSNYFEWAHNRSWVNIQDLFHYNLFVYHFIHTGIGKATFKHLDMIAGTFYSLSKRMRDLRGISFPNLRDADMSLPQDLYFDKLQKYVQLHRDKTFKAIGEQFENDIYEFLFKESGYNKKRLSESLDLSYSVVLQKTKAFTQASEAYQQPRLEAPR